jgi:hypothetical protein
MKRFVKLTVLFATIASFGVLANESSAKGLVKAKPAATHKHRINQYPNDSNPNRNPSYPTGTGGPPPTQPVNPPPVGSPVQPVKHLPPATLPSGLLKAM